MDSIVSKVKVYCLESLKKSRCKTFPFHNVQHTLEVFEHVETIGQYENVSKEKMQILKIAALFHDTGFSEVYHGHEAISAAKAGQFLHKINYSENAIENVVSCINATKMPQRPSSKLDRIICDADLFHLSQPNYFIKSELLKIEWEHHIGISFTEEEWQLANLDFLSKHTYHSQYGQKFLIAGKHKNIDKLTMMLP